MNLPHCSRAYEAWVPVVARVIFGGLFLMGAAFKIPMTSGFAGEAAMTAAAGVPFATPAVFLAFILEVVLGVALIIGWHARTAGFLLAIFTLILALVFYRDFSNPMIMGQFVSHLGLIAGLLYISVYGAQHVAVRRDVLPQG
ncbi:MAG: DoxX family protein [bacterium]